MKAAIHFFKFHQFWCVTPLEWMMRKDLKRCYIIKSISSVAEGEERRQSALFVFVALLLFQRRRHDRFFHIEPSSNFYREYSQPLLFFVIGWDWTSFCFGNLCTVSDKKWIQIVVEPVNEIIIITRSRSGTREWNNYTYYVTCDQRARDVLIVMFEKDKFSTANYHSCRWTENAVKIWVSPIEDDIAQGYESISYIVD